MSLFYKDEHTTCYNYQALNTANFRISHHAAGETVSQINIERSVLIFLLEGEVKVNTANKTFRHKVGNFVLYPCNSQFSYKVLKKSMSVSCSFVQGLQLCNQFSFEMLGNFLPKNYRYEFHALPIRERIDAYLQLLKQCLDDGLNCHHFHEMKENELFILLRAYYSKEELATFFCPLLGGGKSLYFKDFILGNYAPEFNALQLAEHLNISIKTFNRYFKDAFGVTAHKWLCEKKAEAIYRDLTITDKLVFEIALDYNFSSPNYLIAFCKKNLGLTPLEIRQQSEQWVKEKSPSALIVPKS